MARQETLPGVPEHPCIPELTVAGVRLREVRRQRMALTEEEVEAKDEVLRIMHEHDILVYKDESESPPLDLTREAGKEKVKVKMKGEAAEDLEE